MATLRDEMLTSYYLYESDADLEIVRGDDGGVSLRRAPDPAAEAAALGPGAYRDPYALSEAAGAPITEEEVAGTMAGIVPGGAIGMATGIQDIGALGYGGYKAATAEEGQRIDEFLKGFSAISGVIGSERAFELYDAGVDMLPVSDEAKQGLKQGAMVGEVLGLGKAGEAVVGGAKAIAAGQKMAGKADDLDLGLPDDVQPRYFEPGKFEPPTAENPVSVVMPTETEPGIIAFHGSGADFEQFRLEMIGTGEGAQAYGYGLYFTDSEDIARFYKDALGSENLVLPSGQTVRTTNLGDMAVVEDALPSELEQLGVINQAPDGTARYNKPSVLIAEAIGEAGSDDLVGNTRKYLETKLETESSFERQRLGFTKAEGDALEQANINALAAFDRMIEAGIETKTGKMYKVALSPKPEEMLDYQTTFADQPQSVQNALRAVGYDTETASTIEKTGDGRHTVFYIDTKGREAQKDFIDGVAGQTSEQQAKEFAAKQDEMRSKLPMPVVLDALKETLKKQMEAGEIPVDRPDKVLSERLLAEGVPGIKYRAAGSRAASVDAADAEMNYVIFDENAIKILEKYGIVGPVAITAVAAGQGVDSDEGEVM